ncbi:protein of unknown function [Candidatus Nitrosocaldus cavascurensis]|uniref:Uncharacterized protein n=1 Tax=Candidatus Nitrosocaldus cavascurensis TaxID=2058097 RepID=A0A2K5AR14_9ARCH|nr:protein of unknown function [Candidatus Nitrosocaldus cavascurensis]
MAWERSRVQIPPGPPYKLMAISIHDIKINYDQAIITYIG